MADRDSMVTVWDGEFIRETTRELALAGMRNGTLQMWDENGIYVPLGPSMLHPEQFPFTPPPGPDPTINLVDPQQGPKGSQVRVEGTNFTEDSVVKLDSRALATDYLSPTAVIAFIPKTVSLGLKSIVVQNAVGPPTSQMAFEVVA